MIFFKEKNRKKEENLSVGAEITGMMDRLIDELIGEKGEITKKFHHNINLGMTDSLGRAEGEKVVERLLLEYIKCAIAKRREFSTEIENSIWVGRIYQHYYNKMNEISELTVSVYKKQQEMEVAEEEYLFQKNVYDKVLQETFREIERKAKKKKGLQKNDLWKKLFKRVVTKESDLKNGETEE